MPDAFIPILVISILLVGLGFTLNPIVGTVLLTVALGVNGTIVYVFVSDWYKRSRAEYDRERNRP